MRGKEAKIKRGGFSLIEVVISTAILSVSLAAIMGLAVATKRQSRYFLNKTFATLKAADGLELVRHTRDSNLLDKNPQTDWAANLQTSSLEDLNKSFKFNHQVFTRRVKTNQACTPSPCRLIESEVDWAGGQVKLTTQLTDWRLET